jgi:hypothetical protein
MSHSERLLRQKPDDFLEEFREKKAGIELEPFDIAIDKDQ